ncbi:MAG TPA: glycosyltransferase family 2 protein [Gemmatimonadales bacterium]
MADAVVATGVVVLNYDGARYLEHCLDSILACDPLPARLAIVDNASRDDSLSLVRSWAASHGIPMAECVDGAPPDGLAPGEPEPWLILVRMTRHRGCSGGNNAGLRALLRDPSLTHFLMLDNDTEVDSRYFAELADAVAMAPDVGMLSGTIYHFDDRSRVWYAGGRSIPWRALVLHRLEVPHDRRPVPTEFVTGCAMVVSRELLDRIGPMPECYFPVYVEDAEYSHRARESGLPVMYAPGPVVHHRIGSTVGRAGVSPRAKYMDTRHRGFYVRRNFRGWRRAAGLAYLVTTKPCRAVIELLRGRPAMAGALLRGTASGLLSRDASQDSAPF